MEIDRISEFMRIMQLIHKSNANLKAQTGIPQSEFMVLQRIACGQKENSEGITISELSNMVQISKPAVSQVVNALEEKNLVERITTKKDRRVVFVVLTKEGENTISEIHKLMSGKLNSVLERMGEQNSADFLRLFKQFAEIMSEV